MLVNGRLVTELEDLIEAWREYHLGLATPSQSEEELQEKELVVDCLRQLYKQGLDEEVTSAIRSLNTQP